MCNYSGHRRGKLPVVLDKEFKWCNSVTELELIMDRAETGLAQTLKASTSTPSRSLTPPQAATTILTKHSTSPPRSGLLWKELLNTTFKLIFKEYID